MATAAQWLSRGASLGLYPPPSNAARYSEKPLPALPAQRESGASAFSTEVRDAFMFPKKGDDNGAFMFAWELENDDRSVRLCQAPGPHDIPPIRLRQQSMSALPNPKSFSVPHRLGPRSAGLERTIARASEGPDPRPDLSNRHTFPLAPTSSIFIPTVPSDELLSPQPKSSVQKILKLTGNMSPTTSLSTDIPSLHNSSQKIRQLTGLAAGPRRGSEPKLQTLDEEISTISSQATPSLYNYSTTDGNSYAPEESVYSTYRDSFDELHTPLGAPKYANNTSPPTRQPQPLDRHRRDDSFPSPVTTALHLSGFIAADVGVTTPGDMTPIAGGADSWYSEDEDGEVEEKELHSSSSSEISDSEFELEPTAAELYHDTATSIAKESPSSFPSAGMHVGRDMTIPSKLQKMGWGTSDMMAPTRPRGSTQGSIASTVDSTQSDVQSRFSFKSLRSKKGNNNNNTLSERRGHLPSSLDASPSHYVRDSHLMQQSPYPPVSSSIRAAVEESVEDGARLSLLARIFTTGSGSAMSIVGGGGDGKKRGSMASRGSSSRSASVVTTASSASAMPASIGIGGFLATTPPASTWSPDTPSPETATFGDASLRNSAGLLARTMDHARNAAGRKSKADKAEKADKARTSLRGKMKVLKDEGEPGGGGTGSEKREGVE